MGGRVRMHVNVNKEDVRWIDEICDQEIFASRSHAIRHMIKFFQRTKGVSP